MFKYCRTNLNNTLISEEPTVHQKSILGSLSDAHI